MRTIEAEKFQINIKGTVWMEMEDEIMNITAADSEVMYY